MAKTVTTRFEDAWKAKHGQDFLIRVYYKRRYWTGAAYSYESAWNEIKTAGRCGKGGGVVSVGRMSWKLDTQELNIFKSSNLTLRLPNVRNEWLPNNETTGIFRADLTATSGYEPFLTKFQIKTGYLLSDGTEELVAEMTGVSVNFAYSTDRGYVEITVSGNERLLQAADAAGVSDTFTEEACIPAAGDGTNKVFTTTSTGIGRVLEVRVDFVAKAQGSAYSISNLEEIGVPATITFADAPANGKAVDSSGISWKANQTIETLAGLLCDEAGIAEENRSIQNVVFPGGVSGSKTITTEADWTAGTVKTNVSVIAPSGDLVQKWHTIDDFEDGDYTSDPAWTLNFGTASVASGKLKLSGTGSAAAQVETSFTKAVGTFLLYCDPTDMIGAGYGGGDSAVQWDIMKTGSSYYSVFLYPGSSELKVKTSGGSTLITVSFAFTGYHDIRLTREDGGSWEVFIDRVSKGSFSDSTYSVGATMRLGSSGIATDHFAYFDSVSWSPELDGTGELSTASAAWESEVFDLLAAPTAFGVLDHTEDLYGGLVAYYTATSDDNISWDAYVAIGGDGSISSTVRRYLKVKAVLTNNGSRSAPAGPAIHELAAHFSSSSVFVSLATLGGLTCWQALQFFAKLANYEMGFDGDGDFFFRSRNPSGAAVVELSQSRGIASIMSWNPGFDRIVNSAQVNYNGYFSKWDSTDAAEESPTSQERFGTIIRSDDMSGILLANDADLASLMARGIFEYYYLPRVRMRLRAKIVPHLDLSDIVSISCYDDPKDVDNIFGDPLRLSGETPLGLAQNVLARNMLCKVVGIDFDPDSRACDLEVQEILS